MADDIKIVEVNLPDHQYQVMIGSGLLKGLGTIVRDAVGGAAETAGVLGDQNVYDSYGDCAVKSLVECGYCTVGQAVVGGEANKNLQTVQQLYGKLIEGGLERGSPVVAVGGGVIGDTVGFVAGTYLRGVPFVQCPTTLLAMVDASVGGKVGVNLPEGKNLVGAFYQPAVVVADISTLSTLDVREVRCGLAECVKHAVIRDAGLFTWIEANIRGILRLDSQLIQQLVYRNVQIKAKVVVEDEKESGVRAHLNFGHTFAHAIEASAGYEGKWLHGEAVSVGMVAAARLAERIGSCEDGLSARIQSLLNKIGLPTAGELGSAKDLLQLMAVDKKVLGGKIRFVLPRKLGSVEIVNDVDVEYILDSWKDVGAK